MSNEPQPPSQVKRQPRAVPSDVPSDSRTKHTDRTDKMDNPMGREAFDELLKRAAQPTKTSSGDARDTP